jgi:hypothetical protein
MSRHLRREIVALRAWTPFAAGLEVAELSYQAPGWSAPRRLVVVRKELRERPEAKGRRLLEVPGYCNSRADCENRLKELKEGFGADVRKTVLRLGLRGGRRERFVQLLQRLSALGATVARLPLATTISPPRPWHPRQRPARRWWLNPRLLPAN